MRNYLARLGWGHGDDEVFTTEQALAWFDLDGITRAPARFDAKKLDHISARHIAMADDATLMAGIADWLAATGAPPLPPGVAQRLRDALPILKDRARRIPDLLEKAHFLLAARPVQPDDKAARALDPEARAALQDLTPQLQNAIWSRNALEAAVSEFAASRGMKLGQVAQPVRAALAGRIATPSIFDMMLHLGPEESLARLADAAG
jgi:glutamyl-tRNA synthetase